MKRKILAFLSLILTIIFVCRAFAGENYSFGNEESMMPINQVVVEADDELRMNKICLTFDCAYVNDNVKDILDILDANDIKATFFSTLEFIQAHPETIRDIIDRGHDLGSHSVSHPHFNSISDTMIKRQVLNINQYVHDNFNIDMWLFRFPYGEFNFHNMNMVIGYGYFPINWSFDSLDWKNEGTEHICKRMTKHNFVSGDILLFHASGKYTVEALPYVIDYIRQKGFSFLPVSLMLYYDDFTSEWGYMKKRPAIQKNDLTK